MVDYEVIISDKSLEIFIQNLYFKMGDINLVFK